MNIKLKYKKGLTRLTIWKGYLTELMQQVSEQYSRGATLEETLHNVGLSHFQTKIPGFQDEVTGNIEKAYQVISFDN